MRLLLRGRLYDSQIMTHSSLWLQLSGFQQTRKLLNWTSHQRAHSSATVNHDASRRHSSAVEAKVLNKSLGFFACTIKLNQAMLKIQLWNLIGIQSWSQFTCNGEYHITDGNMSSSSTLGGSMHLFSRLIQLPFQVTHYVSCGCLFLRTAFLDVFVHGLYVCVWVVEHAHMRCLV